MNKSLFIQQWQTAPLPLAWPLDIHWGYNKDQDKYSPCSQWAYEGQGKKGDDKVTENDRPMWALRKDTHLQKGRGNREMACDTRRRSGKAHKWELLAETGTWGESRYIWGQEISSTRLRCHGGGGRNVPGGLCGVPITGNLKGLLTQLMRRLSASHWQFLNRGEAQICFFGNSTLTTMWRMGWIGAGMEEVGILKTKKLLSFNLGDGSRDGRKKKTDFYLGDEKNLHPYPNQMFYKNHQNFLYWISLIFHLSICQDRC